jgi:acyl carrier protein
MTDVGSTVKQFILDQFLPGESAGELTETTPLITGGILDSLATMKLITFLEDRYGITMEAHEADPEHLDTIALIEQLVRSKSTQA